jgi:DNA (cytosine-5)-methyltransferase 1
MSLTFTDIFCGAGGSSTGLVAAGLELKLAANHSRVAIATHAANHPDAEHVCADINNYDMRRLPRTDVLWASPICQESSPAGGRKRRRAMKGQLALDLEEYGAIEDGAWERTRATAYDVIRATEIHRYKVILTENVLEFVTDWELYDWWRHGVESLRPGYNSVIVSVSSAHIGGDGNDPAAQWRDRCYTIFVRKDIPMPDFSPRPLAWCPVCETDVRAFQSWRNGSRVGKYKQQYDYRCERRECRHAIVEPYVNPAAAIIDWSDIGSRIGDRKRPLVPNTIARIRAGLAMFPETVSVITVNHSGHDGRAFAADSAPLPVRTVKIGEGLLVPTGGTWNTAPTTTGDPMRTRLANPKGFEALVTSPFVIEFRNHATASPIGDPLATVTGQGNHHGFVVPGGAFYIKNFGGFADPRNMAKPVSEPFGTITTSDHHSLVIPYRNASPKTTAEPLHTLGTVDSAALVRGAIDVEDCYFRMIQPREQLLAQRFPRTYIVHGTKGEQTMQAGNAVSCNVAQWIGERVAAVL